MLLVEPLANSSHKRGWVLQKRQKLLEMTVMKAGIDDLPGTDRQACIYMATKQLA